MALLPELPILSAANRVSEREWHQYVESVYKQSVGSGTMVHELDLNRFNWFFDAKPGLSQLLGGHYCLPVCSAGLGTVTYDGTPWVGQEGPEDQLGEQGFLVRRPFLLPAVGSFCPKLEVSHVRSWWKGGPIGATWFFHTVGSGVFLDCNRLPTQGRVAVFEHRAHWERVNDEVWPEDEQYPAIWMARANVSMMIFAREDFSNWPRAGHGNPRTEIIVRNRDLSSNELDKSYDRRGACLDGDGLEFKLFTGLGGCLPCTCLRSGFLNCDGPLEDESPELCAPSPAPPPPPTLPPLGCPEIEGRLLLADGTFCYHLFGPLSEPAISAQHPLGCEGYFRHSSTVNGAFRLCHREGDRCRQSSADVCSSAGKTHQTVNG